MERRKYGTGSITAKGYIRFGSTEMEHRRVWRKHYGAVPVGFFIHHIDGNKQNNDIANLTLMDVLTHKRIHSGCELRDGEWWKPCKKCGEFKPISTEYYWYKRTGVSMYCRQCSIANSIYNKRRRKLEALNGCKK
jgi:hypothetical protein